MNDLRLILVVLSLAVVACDPQQPASQVGDARSAAAFIDITAEAFDPQPEVSGWPPLALFDFDNDGDIDIFVGNELGKSNYLFRNDGSGRFTDVAAAAFLTIPNDQTTCVGVGDFDNDGWLDLIIGRQVGVNATVRYLRNLGPDEQGQVRFGEGTEPTGLGAVDFAMSIGVGDIDNDGLLDVYVGRYDLDDSSFRLGSYIEDTPNVLLRHTGQLVQGVPVFEDITESAGVAGTRIPGLAPATAEMRNRMPTFAVYFSDVNGDGYQDLFALQEVPGGVDLFINNGDRTFRTAQPELLNFHGGWMGISAGDYDRDGDLDYFLSNVGADAVTTTPDPNHVTNSIFLPQGSPYHRLLENDGGGTFRDVAGETAVTAGVLAPQNSLGGSGLAAYDFAFGTAWFDIDNDGWNDLTWVGELVLIDLLGAGPQRVDFNGVGRLLKNNGDRTFRDVTGERGFFNWGTDRPLDYGYSREGRALAAVDINGDGFVDVCRTNLFDEEVGFHCLINPATEAGHWIGVRLTGSSSNRFGIGAWVQATAGDAVFVGEVVTTTSAFTAVHPQVHFGLGSITTLDQLIVRWPSGAVTNLSDVPVDQVLTIEEPQANAPGASP